MILFGFSRIDKVSVRQIYFPKSAVLYLRHDKNTRDKEILRIHFPSGESVDYRIPIIKVQTYTKDELFDKKLLILLPFYIMRYEDQFAEISESPEKTKQFLNEYQELLDQIGDVLPEEQKGTVYRYLLDSIEKVSNHLLRNKKRLKEKAGEIMGGKLLYLPTDAILDQGRKEGRKEGREEGRKEGLTEDRIEVIFENLELFGTVPNDLVDRIRAIQDFSVLKKLSLLAGKAVSMEDFLQKFDDLVLQNK